MNADSEPYLLPYLQAAERHGDGFKSLLWASPRTQRTRFEAICRAYDPTGKSVLDVGCGRADYLAYLIDKGVRPADYIGIEMVEPLATAARKRAEKSNNGVAARIVQADFIREPARLFVGADIIVFSGSLNTLDQAAFYTTLRRAFDATAEAVVFNFLCSTFLAGREYLTWHCADDVARFAQSISGKAVQPVTNYLPGDCTMCLTKTDVAGRH